MALESERVSVTDTATALSAAETDTVSGSRLVVTNADGSNAIDLGPSDVASGSGYELAAGETLTLDLTSGEQLFGIAASSVTVVAHVLRIGV